MTYSVMSNPVPQAHYAKSRPPPPPQVQPLKTKPVVTTATPLTKNLGQKFNNVVVSTIGAFGSVSMIHQNAINHKQNKVTEVKRKVKVLKKVKASATTTTTTPPITPCVLSATEVTQNQPSVRANTLFTSHNWGSK